jgi:hypothetical protein
MAGMPARSVRFYGGGAGNGLAFDVRLTLHQGIAASCDCHNSSIFGFKVASL